MILLFPLKACSRARTSHLRVTWRETHSVGIDAVTSIRRLDVPSLLSPDEERPPSIWPGHDPESSVVCVPFFGKTTSDIDEGGLVQHHIDLLGKESWIHRGSCWLRGCLCSLHIKSNQINVRPGWEVKWKSRVHHDNRHAQ
jgi:hypothetical protein